jgi:hypothetical protein
MSLRWKVSKLALLYVVLTLDITAQTAPKPHLTQPRMQAFLAQQKRAKQSAFPDAGAAIRAFDNVASGTAVAPPPAPFLGNLTSIQAPSGELLGLGRQSDCSLVESGSTFNAAEGSFSFSIQQQFPHFEQTLHNNSFLTTTPDQFKDGCDDSPLGLYSRLAMYVGKTTDGNYIAAAATGTAALESNDDISVFVITPQGTLQSMTGYAADNEPNSLAVGDLNGDGQNDIVSVSQTSITVFLGNPDGTFQAGVNYDAPSGTKMQVIVIDDVTGDGHLDVVVGETANSSQFAVYPGNGDGTLGIPQLTTAQEPVNYLATGDFNGDGKRDIVTGGGQVFLNSGSGTFTATSTTLFTYDYATTGSAQLAVGDFNKDGKPDIALLSTGTGAITVYLGNGDGTFAPGASYATAQEGDIVSTDLDGDGNTDFYVGLGNTLGFGGELISPSSAYALLGNGDGTLQGAPYEPFYYFGYGAQGTAPTTGNIVDLNGDKKLDALAVTQNAAATSFAFTSYLGNGDGTFKTGPSTDITSFIEGGNQYTFSAITTYAIADFNGDGIPDVAYAGKTTYNGDGYSFGYLVALGNGDGSFKTPVFMVPDAFASGVMHVGVDQITGMTSSDFNHDGKPDLMYFLQSTGLSGVMDVFVGEEVIQLGNGDGTFQAPILVPLSAGTPTAQQISGGTTNLGYTNPALVGDVNGDGIPDLFVYQQSGATYQQFGQAQPVIQLALYLGKGDGTFQAPTVLTAADNPAGQVLLADLNGDGKPDLLSTGTNSSGDAELAISPGNGDGSFKSPTIYLPVSYSINTGNFAVADFNGDGKLDVTLNDGVFLGNGDGTLQVTAVGSMSAPTQTLPISGFVTSSYAGDFNGDGRPDLLSGSTMLFNEYGVAVTGASSSTTTFVATPNPATVGQSVTLTATVAAGSGATGTPTGTVTFNNGTTALGTATLSAGTATFSTASLPAGTYSITAVYSGDSAFAGSTSAAVTLTVNAAPTLTTTTLSASATTATAGTSLSFTAAVASSSGSGTPTGSVTFYDGTTSLGVVTLTSGSAVLSTSSLAVGTHSITATYGGDASFSGSTSAAVSINVTAAMAADFSLSLSPTSGSVPQGQSATSTITLTPIGAFAQQVSLACSGAPQNTTCSLSPAAVSLDGSHAASSTLTIQTDVKTATAFPFHMPGSPTNPGFFASLALLCSGSTLGLAVLRRSHKLRSRAVLQAVCLLGLSGSVISAFTGCGGGSGNKTPTGTYTITINATAGSTTHSATYSLTIQ